MRKQISIISLFFVMALVAYCQVVNLKPYVKKYFDKDNCLRVRKTYMVPSAKDPNVLIPRTVIELHCTKDKKEQQKVEKWIDLYKTKQITEKGKLVFETSKSFDDPCAIKKVSLAITESIIK